MKMKKNIKIVLLISIFALCQNISNGQHTIEDNPDPKKFKKFLENTFFVVGGGDEKFDNHLKAAFQKYSPSILATKDVTHANLETLAS